ncbi:UNVERIFIED_CONTAM: hypothetical protein O8I53_08220 [Campylobacter lari]
MYKLTLETKNLNSTINTKKAIFDVYFKINEKNYIKNVYVIFRSLTIDLMNTASHFDKKPNGFKHRKKFLESINKEVIKRPNLIATMPYELNEIELNKLNFYINDHYLNYFIREDFLTKKESDELKPSTFKNLALFIFGSNPSGSISNPSGSSFICKSNGNKYYNIPILLDSINIAESDNDFKNEVYKAIENNDTFETIDDYLNLIKNNFSSNNDLYEYFMTLETKIDSSLTKKEKDELRNRIARDRKALDDRVRINQSINKKVNELRTEYRCGINYKIFNCSSKTEKAHIYNVG